MESRREFIKKAGVAGGLGAAGALALKKDYVKPVVRLLEPGAALAQTPALSVGATAWSTPVFDRTFMPPPISNTLTLTVDLPGGSAPIPGSTFNAFMSITPLGEPSGWATAAGVPVGSTVNSNTIDNIGSAGPGGVVQFALCVTAARLNGVPITPLGAIGNFLAAYIGLVGAPGASGDRARICCHVDADAGSTIGGTPYSAQVLGFWCFELLWS